MTDTADQASRRTTEKLTPGLPAQRPNLVGDLRARNKTVVIITHLVFEQDRFDLLADLSGGRLTPRGRSCGKD